MPTGLSGPAVVRWGLLCHDGRGPRSGLHWDAVFRGHLLAVFSANVLQQVVRVILFFRFYSLHFWKSTGVHSCFSRPVCYNSGLKRGKFHDGLTQQVHPFPPLYDARSEVLILGSFPSVKSRTAQFFYHHPQNRFWRVLAAVFHQPVPQTKAEKTAFLLQNHVALWDVIARCEITGSSDLSIRNVVPNDLSPILQNAPIRSIFCNGATHSVSTRNICCRSQAVLQPSFPLPAPPTPAGIWSV